MSYSDEAKLLSNNNNNNDKNLINIINEANNNHEEEQELQLDNKTEQQQQQQQNEFQFNNKPPTPPPLPTNLNKIYKTTFNNKMFSEQNCKNSKKYNIELNEEYMNTIYNQKPKIIKYSSVQGTTNANANILPTNSTTLQKRLNQQQQQQQQQQKLTQKDEVIQNNAKNSYYLSDTILYNIDNITNNEKLIERLIISKQGTVRGNLNHVKISLKQFFKENNGAYFGSMNTLPHDKTQYSSYTLRDFESEELNKIVIYTTSLQIVRQSYAKCKRVKKILQNHCVRFEERDLYKNKEYQRELKYRLNLNSIDIPFIFFNGKLIGNCDQLESLSDQGYLNKLFKDLEKIRLRIYCQKCGGYRFVLCTLCSGSKKIYNNFTTLKCTTCNEDGLLRCDNCLDQQE